jgi:transcriptional regulator with XRE-family HTH domain
MLLMTETERTLPGPEPPAEEDGNGHGDGGEDGPSPYERAQRRLRVDGVVFGKALTRLREAEGWSVRTLSRKSGVPLTTLAKLERGETPKPDVEVACALALTFGYGSPGAMLGAGSTRGPAGRGGGRYAADVPAALTLERLVESLLRGIWAANDARPGGALVTEALPEGEPGERVSEALRRVPGPPGMNLYVPLVVLVEPRTVG